MYCPIFAMNNDEPQLNLYELPELNYSAVFYLTAKDAKILRDELL